MWKELVGECVVLIDLQHLSAIVWSACTNMRQGRLFDKGRLKTRVHV